MSRRHRHLRSSTADQAWPALDPGQLAINTADGKIVVGDASGAPQAAPTVPLVPVTPWLNTAKYYAGNIVAHADDIWLALTELSIPSAEPGSGSEFGQWWRLTINWPVVIPFDRDYPTDTTRTWFVEVAGPLDHVGAVIEKYETDQLVTMVLACDDVGVRNIWFGERAQPHLAGISYVHGNGAGINSNPQDNILSFQFLSIEDDSASQAANVTGHKFYIEGSGDDAVLELDGLIKFVSGVTLIGSLERKTVGGDNLVLTGPDANVNVTIYDDHILLNDDVDVDSKVWTYEAYIKEDASVTVGSDIANATLLLSNITVEKQTSSITGLDMYALDAADVDANVTEAAVTHQDGTGLAVSYNQIVAIVVQAIQELDGRVTALEP